MCCAWLYVVEREREREMSQSEIERETTGLSDHFAKWSSREATSRLFSFVSQYLRVDKETHSSTSPLFSRQKGVLEQFIKFENVSV